MEIYLNEKLDNSYFWAFEDEEDKYSEYEKAVWLDEFDGTYDSVDKICKILEISRADIRNAYISKKVTHIGRDAFYGCTSLTSVTIPNSATSIGWYAFSGCTSLTSVTIGNGVTIIYGCSFQECTSLESITIPDSVTRIGYMTFLNCSSLARLTIGDNVKKIEQDAFSECPNLTVYTKNKYVINYCKENGINYDTNIKESINKNTFKLRIKEE